MLARGSLVQYNYSPTWFLLLVWCMWSVWRYNTNFDKWKLLLYIFRKPTLKTLYGTHIEDIICVWSVVYQISMCGTTYQFHHPPSISSIIIDDQLLSSTVPSSPQQPPNHHHQYYHHHHHHHHIYITIYNYQVPGDDSKIWSEYKCPYTFYYTIITVTYPSLHAPFHSFCPQGLRNLIM